MNARLLDLVSWMLMNDQSHNCCFLCSLARESGRLRASWPMLSFTAAIVGWKLAFSLPKLLVHVSEKGDIGVSSFSIEGVGSADEGVESNERAERTGKILSAESLPSWGSFSFGEGSSATVDISVLVSDRMHIVLGIDNVLARVCLL